MGKSFWITLYNKEKILCFPRHMKRYMNERYCSIHSSKLELFFLFAKKTSILQEIVLSKNFKRVCTLKIQEVKVNKGWSSTHGKFNFWQGKCFTHYRCGGPSARVSMSAPVPFPIEAPAVFIAAFTIAITIAITVTITLEKSRKPRPI